MKLTFLLFAIFVSFTVKGQKTKSTRKVLIGYDFSPDYDFRTIKNKGGNSSIDIVIKNRNNIEIAKFGYTTGLNILFFKSQNIGFETGLKFSNKGYQTKNQDLVFFPPDPGLPVKAKTTYSYQYIGIPLKVKFSLGKNKVRFVSGIGFMTNFLLNVKQSAKYEYSTGKTEKNSQSSASGFKKIDISPMISIGIDYNLNNKIHLFAEPTFKYGVIKTKDAPAVEHLWNAGLNLGFYYSFK